MLPYIMRRQLTIFYHRKLSHSIVIILGIEDAEWRACSGEKNEIVGSRRSIDSLKNHKNNRLKKELMSCRSLLSRASRNRAPASDHLLSPVIFEIKRLNGPVLAIAFFQKSCAGKWRSQPRSQTKYLFNRRNFLDNKIF